MSIDSVDRLINLFLEAVDTSTHPQLSIDLLPRSNMELQRVAMEWNERSDAFHIYYGMIGAIDGWLCTIKCPSDVETQQIFFLGIIRDMTIMCKPCVMQIYASHICQ